MIAVSFFNAWWLLLLGVVLLLLLGSCCVSGFGSRERYEYVYGPYQAVDGPIF